MTRIRAATPEDARVVAQLLHGFNSEYEDDVPSVEFLAKRIEAILKTSEVTVFLAGEGPDGFALFRFNPSHTMEGLEAYLAEFYVVPDRRGEGIGRALLRATLDHCRERGAEWIFLGTSTDDEAACALYESEGFTNLEGGDSGPVMLFYEREL